MRIVIVNPNTTQAVTEMLVAEARKVAASGTKIAGVTAAFGVPAIESQAEAAIAGHAVVQGFAEAGAADAGIVGAFVDPGLSGARELMVYPVIGIGEASLLTACLLCRRFAVLTAGRNTAAAIEGMIEANGLVARFAGVRSLEGALLDVADDQAAFKQAFVDAANRVITDDGAEAVILGGAVFVGMAARMGDQVPVPIIDPIHAAVLQAEALARLAPAAPRAGRFARVVGKDSTGLAGPLGDALRRGLDDT